MSTAFHPFGNPDGVIYEPGTCSTYQIHQHARCAFCRDDATDELPVIGRKVPVCLRCGALISDIVEYALEEENETP